MKKIILTSILFAFTIASIAQDNFSSLYFLPKWSHKHTLNAASTSGHSHLSLPIVGDFRIGTNSNLGVSNFLFKSNDPSDLRPVTFLHESVDADKFLSGLGNNNYLRQYSNINLLSFGYYSKTKGFWSFDLNLREWFGTDLPKDLFAFAKKGMALSTNSYDLKDFSVYQTNLIQTAFGYSYGISPNLRAGLRIKYLSGLTLAKINYTKFEMNLDENQVSATSEGEILITNNVFTLPVNEKGNYDLGNMNIDAGGFTKPAGAGFAVDLGVTYKPIPNLTIEAAFNNWGSVKWSASTLQKGTANGAFSFTGFDGFNDTESMNKQIDKLIEDATAMFEFKKIDADSFVDKLPLTVNLSASYSLYNREKNDLLFGLLFQSHNKGLYHYNRLTAAVTYNPTSWFYMSGTFDITAKDVNRIGLALNVSPRWINIFIASDYITPQISKLNSSIYYPSGKARFNLAFGGSICF